MQDVSNTDFPLAGLFFAFGGICVLGTIREGKNETVRLWEEKIEKKRFCISIHLKIIFYLL